MILAIMQPYFFPYVGYFQLMAAVDHFVFYDDAQFIKGGWINRNRVLLENRPHWWTYAVRREGFKLAINRRHYDEGEDTVRRLFAQLHAAYRKAPHYDEVRTWLTGLWLTADRGVATFNRHALESTARRLGLTCTFSESSTLDVGPVQGEEKVLALCQALNASAYINAGGGRSLYDSERFQAQQVRLEFLDAVLPPYHQSASTFVSGLSIIDALMFLGFDRVASMVNEPAHFHA